jgi:hypothetical protein
VASRALGLLLAVVFAALCALHVFWAAGGRWGASVAIPRRAVAAGARPGPSLFRPRSGGTLLVAVALAIAAATVLAQAGWLSLPFSLAWIRRATLALGALFLLRAVGDFRYVGLFKSIRDTGFARYDTFLFVPLCLLLGGGALWLGAAGRSR